MTKGVLDKYTKHGDFRSRVAEDDGSSHKPFFQVCACSVRNCC
jgi:hypothetical protein